MAQANAVFLSVLAGAALLVGLAPGCSNNNTPPASVTLAWTVQPGTHNGMCGAVNDTITIGDDTTDPIQTTANGSSFNGVPVSVNCDVAPNSGGYYVSANVVYGGAGQLNIKGQINVAQGATPTPQSGITGSFSDHVPNGLIANLTDTNCTITFTKRPGMGIAATRIWGVIDCPNAAAANGTICDGNAEFLFEYCGQ
jgi:hypothetical protein